MNPEQTKSGVRWVITTFGAGFAGFVAGRGWVSAETVMSVITSEAFIGAVVAILGGVWGLFTHKQSNAVAIVAEIAKQPDSPVKAIVTKPTLEGREMADSIPGPTIVAAGTAEARAVATTQ